MRSKYFPVKASDDAPIEVQASISDELKADTTRKRERTITEVAKTVTTTQGQEEGAHVSDDSQPKRKRLRTITDVTNRTKRKSISAPKGVLTFRPPGYLSLGIEHPFCASAPAKYRCRFSSVCDACFDSSLVCDHFEESRLELLFIGHNPSVSLVIDWGDNVQTNHFLRRMCGPTAFHMGIQQIKCGNF